MGRQLRIEFPGAFYHVTTRGNERKEIFKSERDREKFLSYLESAVVRYGAVVHAWCLMSNHYHLLVETPSGNLSQVMQHINGAYTNYFNTKRKRSGHLFQGRYKAILVEADEYALELSRYIHLNPVRSKTVSDPARYRWSSYRDYSGERDAPDWLTRRFILGFFGGPETKAAEKYRSFVNEPVGDEEYPSPLEGTVAATILGSSGFVERIQAEHVDSARSDRNLPALRELSGKPAVETIIEMVGKSIAGRSLARKVAIYLCHRHSGGKLREIGARYGIKDSGVSLASRRFAVELEGDADLQRTVENLTKALNL